MMLTIVDRVMSGPRINVMTLNVNSVTVGRQLQMPPDNFLAALNEKDILRKGR